MQNPDDDDKALLTPPDAPPVNVKLTVENVANGYVLNNPSDSAKYRSGAYVLRSHGWKLEYYFHATAAADRYTAYFRFMLNIHTQGHVQSDRTTSIESDKSNDHLF